VPVAVPAVEPAVVPEVAAVVDPVVPELALALAALPVTWTLWPTCLSRSLPPDSTQVEALFMPPAADGEDDAVPVVPEVVPLPDVVVLEPVVPAVVPLLAVVLLPPDAVVELAWLSVRAFVSV